MNTPMHLSAAAKLIAAGFLGFLVGFVMLKSDLIWRRAVSGIFLLYLLLGTVGFFILRSMDLVEVHVVKGYFWASIIGGLSNAA